MSDAETPTDPPAPPADAAPPAPAPPATAVQQGGPGASQRKLIAGTVLIAVLAAAGAAFAAVKLDHATTTVRTVEAAQEPGVGGFGLGGRFGGRGLGSGLGGGFGNGGAPGNGPGPRSFGRGGGFGLGGLGLFGDALTTVANFLGLDATALRQDLQKGQTLAQIAKAQGKSTDGLISAIVAAEEKGLDASVSAGRLTKTQEQQIESRLTQQVTAVVNGTRPSGRGFFGVPPQQAPAGNATA